MFLLFLFASLIYTSVVAVPAETKWHPLSDEFIERINQKAITWRAGRNFNPSLSISYVKGLLGLRWDKTKRLRPYEPNYFRSLRDSELPEFFDSREKWSNCSTIYDIRDQASCGSCWAVAVTSAISDRVCIHNHFEFVASGVDVLSCCTDCGFGCDGGYPSEAWNYWIEQGIVSGGPYKSPTGCKPYPFQPCEHHTVGNRPDCSVFGSGPTPKCKKSCDNNLLYEKERNFGETAYEVQADEKKIREEIFTNGPVVAAMMVHEDFLSYQEGVYQHVYGEAVGGHAIRIIGWGTENGTPYWLVANSWNSDWGNKGYFKIQRGTDECGFESEITAGIPQKV